MEYGDHKATRIKLTNKIYVHLNDYGHTMRLKSCVKHIRVIERAKSNNTYFAFIYMEDPYKNP